MNIITMMDIEHKTLELYHEFYDKHKDLFKTDIQQYWRDMHQYKEEQMIKFKYDGVN